MPGDVTCGHCRWRAEVVGMHASQITRVAGAPGCGQVGQNKKSAQAAALLRDRSPGLCVYISDITTDTNHTIIKPSHSDSAHDILQSDSHIII